MRLIKIYSVFVVVIIFFLGFVPMVHAVTKVAPKAPVKTVAKPAVKPAVKKTAVVKKPTKIIYKQGLVTNAPLIDPKHPPGGPR